jgi:hypothetical protein
VRQEGWMVPFTGRLGCFGSLLVSVVLTAMLFVLFAVL